MKNLFKFICCGSVDDGKSTLIGRILLDTGNVKKDQLEDAKKASLKNGAEDIELAMLLDGLLTEREQQITIDINHRYFDYKETRFHILDCPGHVQYTKNMAIAAAEVDTAIVVIDVRRGIQEQTRRHIDICSLFQVKNICICLTKCDLIWKGEGPDLNRINQLKQEIEVLLRGYSFQHVVIPVSAVTGYNVNHVLETISRYAEESTYKLNCEKDCILHVQAAKLFKGRRYYYGRSVTHAVPKENESFWVYPQGSKVTLFNYEGNGCFHVHENVDIGAGDCVANRPMIVSNVIKQKTIWFKDPTDTMLLKQGTRVVKVIRYTDDIIELDSDLVFNNITDIKKNGFGVLIDEVTKQTLACCIFINNTSSQEKREKKEKTYWITGLPKSGKTTLAKMLIDQFSVHPILLDSESLSKEIFNDLDQSTGEYIEPKLAHLAQQFNRQGFNVVVTCLSRFAAQRLEVKKILGDSYVEIYLDNKNCQGMYEIGTQSQPDLVLAIGKETPTESFDQLFDALKEKRLF